MLLFSRLMVPTVVLRLEKGGQQGAVESFDASPLAFLNSLKEALVRRV